MSQLSSQNYFELFAVPSGFELDLTQLSDNYRKLQSTVHPDKFVQAGDRERRMAVQNAALINEAYQTLKSPLKRARYILQLNGIEFDDERETTFDPAFLMEQMELREDLAAVKGDSDPSQALAKITNFLETRTAEMFEIIKDGIQQQQYNEAKSWILKLQFLFRLKEECDFIEEDLLDAF